MRAGRKSSKAETSVVRGRGEGFKKKGWEVKAYCPPDAAREKENGGALIIRAGGKGREVA